MTVCSARPNYKSTRSPQKRREQLCRLGFESLEQRTMLATSLNSFAHFVGEIEAPREAVTVSMHVRPEDFVMPRGRVLLGFAARASQDSTLDPGTIRVISNEDGEAAGGTP